MNFPIVSQINVTRESLYKDSHTDTHSSMERFSCWMGHKALTVISVPANALTAGFCVTACAVSACTLGTFKVLVYAATLGNVKLTFSTGCYWLSEQAINAISAIFKNAFELIIDAAKIIESVYDGVRWVGRKLNLDELLSAVFKKIGQVFDFFQKRLEKGVSTSLACEPGLTWGVIPESFSLINGPINKYRINFSTESRSFEAIFKHAALSVVNIPLNIVIATCSGIAAGVLCTAFVAKTLLFAATNLNIPIPTYAADTLNIFGRTMTYIIADVGTDVADIFVTVYKISDAIGLNRAVVTALKVVAYIPEAIFG